MTGLAITAVDTALIGVYLSVLYHIYERREVKGLDTGCLWALLFLVMSGGVGGLMLVLGWDAARFILKAFMKPEHGEYIQFAIGARKASPGREVRSDS
jgi:hypothetical protein